MVNVYKTLHHYNWMVNSKWPKLLVVPMVDVFCGNHADICKIFSLAFQQSQIKTELWAVEELMGKPVPQVVEVLAHRNHPNPNLELIQSITSIIQQHLKVYFGDANKPKLNADFKSIIPQLKNNGVLIGLTSWLDEATTLLALKQIGLEDSIDAIVSQSSVERAGPFPDSIFKLLQTLKIQNADDVAHLGKTKTDLLSGYHAGCKWNILLASDVSDTKWNAYPHTHIVPSLNEIPAIISLPQAKNNMSKLLGKKLSIKKRLR